MHHQADKVLVVEDEPLLRDLAVEMLADTGRASFQAGSAAEAMAILTDHAPEICILFTDVNMAGAVDGLALAKAVGVSWPWISILITSGRAAPPRDEMPSRARFIPKPWRQDRLLDLVGDICPPSGRLPPRPH